MSDELSSPSPLFAREGSFQIKERTVLKMRYTMVETIMASKSISSNTEKSLLLSACLLIMLIMMNFNIITH